MQHHALERRPRGDSSLPFPVQSHNGKLLHALIRKALSAPGSCFTSCECVMLVPGVRSQVAQAKLRLQQVGLLGGTGGQASTQPQVHVYSALTDATAAAERAALHQRIIGNEHTLFLAIQVIYSDI